MLMLITDRDQADVSRWRTLREKGFNNMTASELSERMSPMKGRYDASDLNRVGKAVEYLAMMLGILEVDVSVAPKTDWREGELPTLEQMQRYLANIHALKDAFYGTVELPETMRFLTHDAANAIEQLLLEVEANITHMTYAFRHSGTFYSAQGGLRA